MQTKGYLKKLIIPVSKCLSLLVFHLLLHAWQWAFGLEWVDEKLPFAGRDELHLQIEGNDAGEKNNCRSKVDFYCVHVLRSISFEFL